MLAIIDSKWQYVEAEKSLKQAGKNELTYGMYPITLNESFKNKNFQSAGYSAGWGVAISKSAKDPVRIIKFLDWLASDEAQILNNWGIEGVHYKIENGKRVIPKEEMDQRVKDPSGQTYTIKSEQQIIDGYTTVEKEVLAKYNAKMWQDLYPKASEFPSKPWGAAWQINIPQDTDGAIIFQKAMELSRKRIPELIMASPKKFDELWDSFQKELEQAGVKKLETQFDALLKERIKMWNE